MNSVEMKRLVLVELEKAKVKSLFPQFSEDWVTDCSIFEATLVAPVSALLPNDAYGEGFGSVAWLAHHLARATWKCQMHQDNGEILVQNQQQFEFASVPAQADLLCIKGMLSTSADGLHHLEFKLTSLDHLQNISFIGRGTSTLRVFHPIPQPTPASTPPLPAPSTISTTSRKSSSAKFEPSEEQPPSKRSSSEREIKMETVPLEFTLINTIESRGYMHRVLSEKLLRIGVTPTEVSFSPMLVTAQNHCFFNFKLQNQEDARKVEKLIKMDGGFECFKLSNLKKNRSFFFPQISVAELLKAIIISYKYDETVGGVEYVLAMIRNDEEVRKALSDVNMIEELKMKLSKKGRRELHKLLVDFNIFEGRDDNHVSYN